MGGDLLIAPLLLVAAAPLNLRELPAKVRGACLLAALVGTSVIVFAIDMPIKYMLFPPMLWAALRFRQVGAGRVELFGHLHRSCVHRCGARGLHSRLDRRCASSDADFHRCRCCYVPAAGGNQQPAEARRGELRKAHEGLEETVRERTAVLERSNTELALQGEIAANMAEGVMVVSPQGTIAYANPTFETMFGYGPGELDDKPVSVLNAANGSTPEEPRRRSSGNSSTKACSAANPQHQKDGTPFWTHAEVSTFDRREIGGKSGSRSRGTSPSRSSARKPMRGYERSWSRPATRSSYVDGRHRHVLEPRRGASLRLHRRRDDRPVDRPADPGGQAPTESATYCRSSTREEPSAPKRAPAPGRKLGLGLDHRFPGQGQERGGRRLYGDPQRRHRAASSGRGAGEARVTARRRQRVAHIGSWSGTSPPTPFPGQTSSSASRLRDDEFDGSFEAFMECIHPDDRELVDGIVKKAFRDGDAVRVLHRCVRPHERSAHSTPTDGSSLTTMAAR